MRMKKIISGVLAVLFVALVGCRPENPNISETLDTPAPSAPNLTEETFPMPEDYPVYSGQWQASDEPLTVYVDALYKTSCDNLQAGIEYLAGQTVKIDWIFLPDDSAQADALLTQMRTEMMAGKGPDLFLATCPNPFALSADLSGPPACFFQNPEKTMQSDAFLPMDGLLENAQFMNVDGLTKAILSAGRTQSGQVALPLSYTYNAAVFSTAELSAPNSLPTNWEDLSRDSTLDFGQALIYGLCSAPGQMANYSSGELLFTENDLIAWTTAAYAGEGSHIDSQETGVAEARSSGFVTQSFLAEARNGKKTVLPLWNADGGVTAFVSSFAAINKNTAQANNAMFLVDVLCSQQILSDQGFESEKNGHPYWVGSQAGLRSHDIPIDRTAIKRKGDIAILDEIESHINAVRFFSDIDRVFFDLAFIDRAYGEELSELDIQVAASNAYGTFQMIISE